MAIGDIRGALDPGGLFYEGNRHTGPAFNIDVRTDSQMSAR
jgi:hypothetical protein